MKEWLMLPVTLVVIVLALPVFLFAQWLLDRRPLECACGGRDEIYNGARLRHICTGGHL